MPPASGASPPALERSDGEHVRLAAQSSLPNPSPQPTTVTNTDALQAPTTLQASQFRFFMVFLRQTMDTMSVTPPAQLRQKML
jgi:hypothetical protein